MQQVSVALGLHPLIWDEAQGRAVDAVAHAVGRLRIAGEPVSYTRIKSAFESLHLWLVVCDDECALLLQKKDLRFGNADSFLSDIISKMNTGTDVSG